MVKGSRGSGALVLAVAILTGCGGSPQGGLHVTPSPSGSAAGQAPGTATDAPGTSPGRTPAPGGGGAGAGGNPGGGATTTRTPPGGTQPPAGTNAGNPDDGGLGSMSRAFLRPAPYGHITLEVASAPGSAPSAAVESNLVSVLQTHSNKTVGSADHGLTGKGGACWTLPELNAVATQQRQAHTGGGTAALFMGFLDGSFCDNKNILGLAYGASAVVIFTNQVKALATPTVGPDVFMKSVTVHETGHILGLINIGYVSPTAHDDGSHHSNNPNSVMYAAIDQANLIQQFLSGPPTTFDSSDEADLAGLRSGSL